MRGIVRLVIFGVFAVVCACGQSNDILPTGANFVDVSGIQTYRGRYTNVDYGFSVVIPQGMVGTGAATGAPNHGFQIQLHPDTVIWVDASYDAAEPPFHFSRINAKLGVLKAQRTSWISKAGKLELVHESIISRRYDRGTPILYTISVDTPPSYKDEALRTFTQIVSSFKLVPIFP